MYPAHPTRGNTSPFFRFIGGPVLPPPNISGSTHRPGIGQKLNPRAAPFVPRATSHPTTPPSPSRSDLSSASTVVQATLPSDWHHFAPRVPVAGLHGAGMLEHPGNRGQTYYASTQARVPVPEPRPTTRAEEEHAAALAQYCATYCSLWGGPWSTFTQPVRVAAPAYLTGYWNNGVSDVRKSKKKGKKRKGKGAAWRKDSTAVAFRLCGFA